MADVLCQFRAIYCQVGDPHIWPFNLGFFGHKIIGPCLSIFALLFYSTWDRLMQVAVTNLAQLHDKKKSLYVMHLLSFTWA